MVILILQMKKARHKGLGNVTKVIKLVSKELAFDFGSLAQESMFLAIKVFFPMSQANWSSDWRVLPHTDSVPY